MSITKYTHKKSVLHTKKGALHRKGALHLNLVLGGCKDKDNMADAPHRLCPSGSWDKDGSSSHSQLSCPRAQDNEKRWTNPESLIVHMLPCCHFGCWTPFRTAASGTGVSTQLPLAQLLSAQVGLSWTWAHLLAQFHTAVLTPMLLSITMSWNCISVERAAIAEDRVCRADPDSIPAGEREAKWHTSGGALTFSLP